MKLFVAYYEAFINIHLTGALFEFKKLLGDSMKGDQHTQSCSISDPKENFSVYPQRIIKGKKLRAWQVICNSTLLNQPTIS